MAYVSDESGLNEVYLRRFPRTEERWRVSVEGGSSPAWNGDGTELYYRAPDGGLAAVPVTLAPTVRIGPPQRLFDEATSGVVTARGWEASRDGQRFLMVRRSEAGRSGHIIVVQNWLAEFEQ